MGVVGDQTGALMAGDQTGLEGADASQMQIFSGGEGLSLFGAGGKLILTWMSLTTEQDPIF